jgi:hypothetical protein
MHCMTPLEFSFKIPRGDKIAYKVNDCYLHNLSGIVFVENRTLDHLANDSYLR